METDTATGKRTGSKKVYLFSGSPHLLAAEFVKGKEHLDGVQFGRIFLITPIYTTKEKVSVTSSC